MCGIAGIWDYNDCTNAGSAIISMTNALIHRGPDSFGHWQAGSENLHFGHRRLSIIDLSEKGAQPMSYMSRYTITFNGEIYNYPELQDTLISKGYSFDSDTDTEVVMAAYDFWGTACLTKFDGMFAFALYDKNKNELFCARDRFGEKPFHYYIDKDKFAFASEMKSLFAIGIDRAIDDYSMYLFLNMGIHEDPADKERTFYKHIKRLKPGHYFHLQKSGQIHQKKYWNIDIRHVNTEISFAESCEKFRDLFFLSTTRRLRSDVPVGTSLSGGLDSSAVALVMNQVLKNEKNQKCFSARFDDPILDEGKYMKEVISGKNISHHVVFPSSDNLTSEIEKIMYHQEEPFASSSIYAQWKVFELARENNVTVLLDGQGADETLAGYTYYFQSYLTEIQNKCGKNAQQDAIFQIKQNNEILPNSTTDFEFRPQSLILSLLKKTKHTFLRAGSTSYIHNDLHRSYSRTATPFNSFSTLNSALLNSTCISGLDKLLRFADRNAMAHSVEVRLPFLFHELVEFVFSLPADHKIRNGWTKALMRYSLEDILPTKVCWRKTKIGFQPPQKKWENDPLMNERMKEYQQIAVDAKYIKPNINPCWEGFITGVFLSNSLK